MAYQIDINEVRNIIGLIVERWSGTPLSQDENQIVDQFVEMEVKPLSNRQLLNRMGSPADALNWFLHYVQERLSRQPCDTLTDSESACVCCTC